MLEASTSTAVHQHRTLEFSATDATQTTLLSKRSVCYDYQSCGEVSERLKELASKASVGEILPWVQIPPSPPTSPNGVVE
jgi:hypothetical protein